MDKKPLRIYKTSLLARFIMLLLIVGLGSVAIFTLTTSQGLVAAIEEWGWAVWPLWIASIPFVAWMIFQSGTEELRIYQDGIEHRRGNTSSFAKWESLSHFGQANRNPCIISTVETNKKHEFFIHLPTECGIPLDMHQKGLHVDIAKLRQKEIGQDIYRFAPHLFEGIRKKAKS